MKKIFVFIGSQKGKASNTSKFTQVILDGVAQKLCDTQEDLKIDFYTARDVYIKSCQGCLKCFTEGTCPFDQADDMAQLKSKMIEADFIVWGSPVYAHNVSGDMKRFIDRISYWTHLMKLAGKPGFIVSTTLHNGNMFVLDYLYKIMAYFGIKVVGKFSATIVEHMQQNNEISKKEIENHAGIILDYILGKKTVKSDDYLERLFHKMKQNAKEQKPYETTEYLFWHNSGYLYYDSFAELLESLNKIPSNYNHMGHGGGVIYETE